MLWWQCLYYSFIKKFRFWLNIFYKFWLELELIKVKVLARTKFQCILSEFGYLWQFLAGSASLRWWLKHCCWRLACIFQWLFLFLVDSVAEMVVMVVLKMKLFNSNQLLFVLFLLDHLHYLGFELNLNVGYLCFHQHDHFHLFRFLLSSLSLSDILFLLLPIQVLKFV